MLVTMLTAMYVVVRAVEQLSLRWMRQEPLPYLVSQPLPWQVHSVSHSRRGSRGEQFQGQRRNSIGVYRKTDSSVTNGQGPPIQASADKAATTIQNQYRKYQQKKQQENQ